ncbi:MAG TPA: Arm DNA-binding domain-containing protein [Novosphingobium sp.]
MSDTAIRAAKPREKQYKLNDEKGLLLIVRPTGGRLWRLKYRFAGKEQQFTIGTYPEVGLKEARERRDVARALLAQGKDPSAEKKREKVAAAISAGNTFKLVAEEHIAKRQREGAAAATIAKAHWHLSRLEKLHNRPIAEIEAFEVLDVLRKLETRGNLEAARQIRAFASRTFRYGVATTRCKADPAALLVGALIAPRSRITPPSLTPRKSASCSVPSTDMKDNRPHISPSGSLRMFSSVPANCGKLSGASLILKAQFGLSLPAAQKCGRNTRCRLVGRHDRTLYTSNSV